MDGTNAWYDEDRADEAALGLMWIAAAANLESRHNAAGFARDILRRLEERRLIRCGRAGFTFTDLGRTSAKAAFDHLFGKPIPAVIEPTVETHVVEEIDGD